MPYITEDARRLVSNGKPPETEGELAYIIYCIMVDWSYRRAAATGGPNYTRLSSAVGVLETVRHEFCRRILDPYENKKREENTDVTREEAEAIAKQIYGPNAYNSE